MSKSKIFSIILSFLLLIVVVLGSTYYFSFYPRTNVKSINSSSDFNAQNLLDKVNSNDLRLSSKSISLETSLSLSEDDLTDLFISIINNTNNSALNALTGLKIETTENKINVLFHLNYNNIPFEGKLIFSGNISEGKFVLHYESGNLGFIKINKDLLFSTLKSNDMIFIDKDNSNIILDINIKGIEIKDLKITNNEIILNIKGTFNFDDINHLK